MSLARVKRCPFYSKGFLVELSETPYVKSLPRVHDLGLSDYMTDYTSANGAEKSTFPMQKLTKLG